MKIAKMIMVLSFVYCGMAIPVAANLLESSQEYQQLGDEVSKLSENNVSPVVRKLTIAFVEKNIQKLIKKKESRIRYLVREIEDTQELIQKLHAGELSDWDIENEKETEAKWVVEIENHHARISECQEQLQMYEELLREVQALKSRMDTLEKA